MIENYSHIDLQPDSPSPPLTLRRRVWPTLGAPRPHRPGNLVAVPLRRFLAYKIQHPISVQIMKTYSGWFKIIFHQRSTRKTFPTIMQIKSSAPSFLQLHISHISYFNPSGKITPATAWICLTSLAPSGAQGCWSRYPATAEKRSPWGSHLGGGKNHHWKLRILRVRLDRLQPLQLFCILLRYFAPCF